MPERHLFEKKLPLMEVKAGSLDLEARTLRAVLTRRMVDRDSEVVEPKGCKKRIKSFLKNPIMLWAHTPWEPPIGHWTELDIQDEFVEATANFLPEKASARADEVFACYAHGSLRSFSIGFKAWAVSEEPVLPKQQGVTITDWELFEASCVAIPANTEALAKTIKILREVNHELIRIPQKELKVLVANVGDLDILTRAGEILHDRIGAICRGEEIPTGEQELIDLIRIQLRAMTPAPTPLPDESAKTVLEGIEAIRADLKRSVG